MRKPGVDFADSVEVFYDPLGRILQDPDHHRQRRYILIGEDAQRRVSVVVYSQPDPGVIRIIFARPVTPGERRYYEQP